MSFAAYCQQKLPIELPAAPVAPAPCDWRLGKKYRVSASEDKLTEQTYNLIRDCMRRQWWFHVPYYQEIERTIGTQWIVNRHPRYVGSWVKRFRKYMTDFHNSEYLRQVDWGAVGSIIGESRNGMLEIMFDEELDWEDGDYADNGSCIFNPEGCRHDVLDNLRDAGIQACLVHQNGTGIARCLIYRRVGSYVVWNAYGMTSQKFARVLSTWHGCGYEKIKLENHGKTDGRVWVNTGGGWIVGPPERIESISYIDMNIDCNDNAECRACGCEVEQEESIEWNGDNYCQDCLSHCEHCDDYCLSEDSVIVHKGRYHETWCTNCADNDAIQCPCCDEMIANS